MKEGCSRKETDEGEDGTLPAVDTPASLDRAEGTNADLCAIWNVQRSALSTSIDGEERSASALFVPEVVMNKPTSMVSPWCDVEIIWRMT